MGFHLCLNWSLFGVKAAFLFAVMPFNLSEPYNYDYVVVLLWFNDRVLDDCATVISAFLGYPTPDRSYPLEYMLD